MGPSLQLRPLLENDFESLYQCAADPLIWEMHPQKNRYERGIFESFFNLAMESRGALAVVDIKSSSIIGSSRYYDFLPERPQITIGYTFLARAYWGGQSNREMKSLMLEHAFKYVDVVQFEIGELNLRSRRAIEKIGAVFVEKRTLDDKSHVIYRVDRSCGLIPLR